VVARARRPGPGARYLRGRRRGARRRGFRQRRPDARHALYVEPDFQNQGLGRGLLDALFGQLVADGYDTAILWMLAENPTRFFYESMGGEQVGERIDTLAGADVEEVAYAWHDLESPLQRRSRVAEE
jgi:GNAT superfamily N-acetyltransferase